MPRIVTYCRVAAQDPARPLDAHELKLRALIARHPQHRHIGAFHDIHCSGLSPALERPGLGALLTSLAANPAEILLVPALHHLTRDARALPGLRAALARHGLLIRTAADLDDDLAPTAAQLLFTHTHAKGT